MSSSMTCTLLTVYTISAIIVQIIGLSLFVMGFFPVKPALSGVSGPASFRSPLSLYESVDDRKDRDLPPHHLRSLYQELSGVPPSFGRLIFLVIDGLPAEFILGKGNQPPSKALMDAMPYTQSLLANGMAIGYHAKAAPPTVTMPRLKAMVSGAIGGFLDVAFNFNTHAYLDDNLLGQFLSIGWRMVMLGDETWLKLFPGLFTRHDGVSSFYVKDTVQVDHNVSRHLSNELNRDDWNLLILHYLGLDHVGHIGGRNSVLMAPKLKEMDEIIKMIHLSTSQPQEYNQGQTLLMVVSDHGMTENGNHGGSSFEETDSLILFVDPKFSFLDCASATSNAAYQVDIAPTLALLFGMPIPKNNVGVMIPDIFNSLKDGQQLRALELNSWQLLRLLQEQLPGLSCGNSLCDDVSCGQGCGTSNCSSSAEDILCCLYCNADFLHNSWKSKNVSRLSSRDDYKNTVTAYYDFLRTASEWLSRKATDKPIDLLALGVAAMLLSCLMLLSLLFCLCRECYPGDKRRPSDSIIGIRGWHLDETYVLAVIFILVISMGSSSMIEEEQYIWHFVTSTFYLVLLRKTLQFFPVGTRHSSGMIKEQNRSYFPLSSILVLLICGRILRGWHQGGVNWTHLPDISKWLERAGNVYIKLIQLVSAILLISLSLLTLSSLRIKRNFVLVLGFIYLISALLVLEHIIKSHDHISIVSNYSATLLTQIIYAILGICSTGTLIASPWILPVRMSDSGSVHNISSIGDVVTTDAEHKSHLVGLRNSTYVIGWAYICCWCLLQLLLQKPINSIHVLLLYVQILASMHYYSSSGSNHKQWVQVAGLYFLGMAGHFSLGNSNTLATIDVAGAFIGISSHSTLLSGILMFAITYASPILVLLSMVMYISVKDTSYQLTSEDGDVHDMDSGYLLKMMISFPCLVPLGLNSILLSAYTIVLLLMRNHLFVWSVFSPKYLYVCAATVCVYVGVFVVAATGFYTCSVFFLRRKMLQSSGNNTNKKLH